MCSPQTGVDAGVRLVGLLDIVKLKLVILIAQKLAGRRQLLHQVGELCVVAAVEEEFWKRCGVVSGDAKAGRDRRGAGARRRRPQSAEDKNLPICPKNSTLMPWCSSFLPGYFSETVI